MMSGRIGVDPPGLMTGAGSHRAPHVATVGFLALRETPGPRLSEGEDVGPDARVEERDVERAIGAGVGLAHELVEPRLVDPARPRLVDVAAVRRAGGLPVEAHLEADGAGRRRGQDEVEIAGPESVRDRSALGLEHGRL